MRLNRRKFFIPALLKYEENYETEEIYTCLYCGHEDRADKFGKYCPNCWVDLDELEKEHEQ